MRRAGAPTSNVCPPYEAPVTAGALSPSLSMIPPWSHPAPFAAAPRAPRVLRAPSLLPFFSKRRRYETAERWGRAQAPPGVDDGIDCEHGHACEYRLRE